MRVMATRLHLYTVIRRSTWPITGGCRDLGVVEP
jgi:hypothetical protein